MVPNIGQSITVALIECSFGSESPAEPFVDVGNSAGDYVRGRPLPSFPSATVRPHAARAIEYHDPTTHDDNGQEVQAISFVVSYETLRTTLVSS